MSDTNKKLEELENLIKKSITTRPYLPLSGWTKYVVPIVIVVGIITGYATLKANVVQMEKNIIKIESTTEKQEGMIDDIKLKAVEDSSDIKHIKKQIDTMDKKLDRILDK